MSARRRQMQVRRWQMPVQRPCAVGQPAARGAGLAAWAFALTLRTRPSMQRPRPRALHQAPDQMLDQTPHQEPGSASCSAPRSAPQQRQKLHQPSAPAQRRACAAWPSRLRRLAVRLRQAGRQPHRLLLRPQPLLFGARACAWAWHLLRRHRAPPGCRRPSPGAQGCRQMRSCAGVSMAGSEVSSKGWGWSAVVSADAQTAAVVAASGSGGGAAGATGCPGAASLSG